MSQTPAHDRHIAKPRQSRDRIRTHPGAEKVLAVYADSVATAKRMGHAVIVTLRVGPDGNAESISGTDKPDALDAALLAAKARGQSKIADILKRDEMLTAREFGQLIGASHETVNVKRKRFEVLGLEGATRGVKYPEWQLTNSGLPLPGLSQVFSALGGQPWTVYRFLQTAHSELGGRTGLDALKADQLDAVLEIAHNQSAGAFA